MGSYQSAGKNGILLEVFRNLQPWRPWPCIQDCHSLIVQVEYQGQTWNTKILELKPVIHTSYHIQHRLEKNWNWKHFTLHNFCSMLIEPLFTLEKVRTENWKFRTDLQDQVIDDNNHLQGWIAQKIYKSKIEACPVKAGDYIAFKNCISFATNLNLAANFGCNWLNLIQKSRLTLQFSKLLHTVIWSHCASLFKSEQMPFPHTRCQFRSAALHRIQFFLFLILPMSYSYSETNDCHWLIEKLSKAMGSALVCNDLSPISSHEKKSACSSPKITKHWGFFDSWTSFPI